MTSHDSWSHWWVALILRNSHTNLDLFSWHVSPVISSIVLKVRMCVKDQSLNWPLSLAVLQRTMYVSRMNLWDLFVRGHRAEAIFKWLCTVSIISKFQVYAQVSVDPYVLPQLSHVASIPGPPCPSSPVWPRLLGGLLQRLPWEA